MNTTLTYLVAEEHINDLLHEADRRRAEIRRRRPITFTPHVLWARRGQRTVTE
jgi:hypothetical protein